MKRDDFTFEGGDGTSIEATSWLPEDAPAMVVQIAHGASEHLERYGDFAARLVEDGYGVYAIDHRGHGRSADRHGSFGIARPGGWNAIIDDSHRLSEIIRSRHPGVRIVLFGHSMGSFIAQAYIQRWGHELAGLILSGSSHGLEGADVVIPLLEAAAADQADVPSEIFAAMFAGFNAPFDREAATGFEWLSRDPAEVQKYVDDPWCGAPLSNGFVLDMLRGMMATWDPEAEASVPRGLPTLIISGSQDPVGGFGEGVGALAARFEELGVHPVTFHLYPDARHELLNETIRDRVYDDIRAWLSSVRAD
jgi:alpha-beta hydrolase superfamily lysophospholipase